MDDETLCSCDTDGGTLCPCDTDGGAALYPSGDGGADDGPDDDRTLFLCDPALNTECNHYLCSRWGRGDCFQTVHERYAQRTDNGYPIITYRDDLPADCVFEGTYRGSWI